MLIIPKFKELWLRFKNFLTDLVTKNSIRSDNANPYERYIDGLIKLEIKS